MARLMLSVSGLPSTMAIMMMLIVPCIGVLWKSWLRTTCSSASLFRSMTMRVPFLSLSLRMSCTSWTRSAWTASAILATRSSRSMR